MRIPMNRITASFLVTALITLALSGCANTIRGVGQDTANAVDATQDAGRKVVRSVGG